MTNVWTGITPETQGLNVSHLQRDFIKIEPKASALAVVHLVNFDFDGVRKVDVIKDTKTT